MAVTFKYDMRQFNATLRRAAQESSRAAPDVINGHALAVTIKAVELTEKANRDQIAHILGQTGTQLNYTKKGDRLKKRSRGGAIIKDDSFAARIVNARRKEFAGPDYMLWGNALEQAAKKLIAARQKATAFIKSGWLWALRDLAAVVKGWRKSNPDREAKASGVRKGKANPARPTGGIFGSGMFKATIENTALIASGGKFQSKGAHNPLPIAEKGLRLALAAENANMEAHLKKKMTEAMKRAGAL